MAVKTLTSQTFPTAITGVKPATVQNRFGLGLVVAEPPAGFLSLGRFSSPRLLVSGQARHRKDMGNPNMRDPVPSEAPAGPVGSFSGATACRSGRAALAAAPANPSFRTASEPKSSAKGLWRPGDTATAADLESKLNPFRPDRDYQSPSARKGRQPDHQASASWQQVGATAATAAK